MPRGPMADCLTVNLAMTRIFSTLMAKLRAMS